MIFIVPFKNSWNADFQRIGSELKQVMGSLALGIHHIGSTSVQGLAAKDIIDIQLTVSRFNTEIEFRLKELGFKKRKEIVEDHRPAGRADILQEQLKKQFYQKTDPTVNLHVRIEGFYNQRFPILCRDYLRAHPDAASAYELIKVNLAKHFPKNIEAYYEIKDPVFDIIIVGAEAWAAKTNWTPTCSDII